MNTKNWLKRRPMIEGLQLAKPCPEMSGSGRMTAGVLKQGSAVARLWLPPVLMLLSAATVQAADTVNTATISLPPGLNDPDTNNNTSTDTDPITSLSDLVVTKDNATTSVDSGGQTIYVVRVTNNGPSSVTGATFTDPAASGLTKTAVACSTAAPGQCVTAPTISELEGSSFALPALASGQFYEITVTADVTANSGTVTNAATATVPTGWTDPDTNNNTGTDTDTVVPLPVLTLVKNVVNTGVGAAVPADWTLTAVNGGTTVTGASGAPAVTSVSVPVGTYTLTESGGPVNASAYTAGSFSCTDGSLTGNSLTLVNGENATCTITNTYVPQVDMIIVKSNGAVGVTSGTSTTYTITVTNNGPDQVTGAVVQDTPVSGVNCPAGNAVTITGDGVPLGSFTVAELTSSGIALGTLNATQSTVLSFACTVN